MSEEKVFRVWSKEYGEYLEDHIDFYLCPDGVLCWCDDYGDMHKADPEQYEVQRVNTGYWPGGRVTISGDLLKELYETLSHAAVFVRTREKDAPGRAEAV